MILAHDHAGRRTRLAATLTEAGADVALITSPVHVRYLTGFTGSNGQVVVHSDGDAMLVTDDRYDGRAAIEAADVDRRVDRDPVRVLLAELGGPSALVFEADHLTHQAATELQRRSGEAGHRALAGTNLVQRQRITKEPSEIDRLQTACEITDEAVMLVWEGVEPGWTERRVATAITRRMEDLGADGPSFAPIVASGPNGAVPHHTPSDRELQPGDLVTIDVGALVDGYHADWTRTLSVGATSGQLVEIHALVCEAQRAGRDAVTAGMAAVDLDAACRDIIIAAGHGDRFVHGTGHGAGLEIHEAPMVGATSGATVPAHATVTVEPGIYLPGVGGVRIEDLVLVMPDGPCTSLTTTPRDLH